MQKKNMILTVVLSIVLVLMITIGASYAYFTATMLGEDTTTITVKGGKMLITYAGGDEIEIYNVLPDENPIATKTFTVAGYNNTSIDMGYKISLVVESNTFSDVALKYKLISTNTDNNGTVAKNITDLTDIPTGTNTITLGYGDFDVPTDGNKTHTYKLELYFPNQGYDQNIEQQKQINAYVVVENFDTNMLLPYNKTKGVNNPVLFTGMTPVKWDDSFNEIETTFDDRDWYDYNNKKWANAKTADGSYWVWIPRYAYKITSGYHKGTAGTIDIVFLKENTIENDSSTTIETTGYVAGTYDTSIHHFLHPAFEKGGAEFGFWVAKFEPTAAESVATITGSCDAADNVSTKTVKVVPNTTSWRCINMFNAYNATLSMKTNPVYGWEAEEVDPHLLTNQEWGAITYLSKSTYGADTEEIWNNAFYQYRTGCSGEGVDAANEETCVAYNTTNGVKASTTHNIYGVYDMSGGSWDRVMGNYNNISASSGFLTETLNNINSKYINRYFTKTEDLLGGVGMAYDTNIYGDAVYETSYNASRYNGKSWIGAQAGSWYGDSAYLPRASAPWFVRGGSFGHSASAGPFGFGYSDGNAFVYYSFRPGVCVAS